MNQAKVGIIMGSDSDWSVMRLAAEQLKELSVVIEKQVVSAHRTPRMMFEYAQSAEARGLKCIIAGAGGAAHLPGMVAALTSLPVLGVPIPSQHFSGQDSLLSIVQMPKGTPVATFAVGEAGAINAALFACKILSFNDRALREKLCRMSEAQTKKVKNIKLTD